MGFARVKILGKVVAESWMDCSGLLVLLGRFVQGKQLMCQVD